MTKLEDGEFTSHLDSALEAGESGSMRKLFPMVYRELKAVAHRQLGGARGHSLDTTGLVHEVYFKVAEMDRSVVQDRAHFLAISALAMRQVLVAAARKRNRLKRGSGERPATLTESSAETPVDLDQVLLINGALDKLTELDPRLASLVECRFFGGLTETETAEALGLSLTTVQRDWRRAKAWLRRYLQSENAQE